MASTHPYVFYGDAQGFQNIGSGKIIEGGVAAGTKQMIKDLVVARWLKLMADDPTQDPKAVLKHCQAYWGDDKQAGVVSALVQHQGSLYYSNPDILTFEYLEPLPSFAQVVPKASQTAAPAKATKAKPKVKKAAKKKAAPKPVAVPSTVSLTTVIGDSGKPVDWWFIYKISETARTNSRRSVTGAEYVYFDSNMAEDPDSQLVLSKHPIRKNSALEQTLAPIFSDAAKANKSFGWY